jgi:hypothetical protein
MLWLELAALVGFAAMLVGAVVIVQRSPAENRGMVLLLIAGVLTLALGVVTVMLSR